MHIRTIAVASVIWAASFGAALADRAPNAQERAAIESALRSEGFTAWEEIELDDGKWEVDDAVHSDGKEYDVDLAVSTYAVLKKDLDD